MSHEYMTEHVLVVRALSFGRGNSSLKGLELLNGNSIHVISW